MVHNFDTKGKSFFHPYNTRSSSTRPHLPAPPSPKDTTNLPRRSNEVINDKPCAGGPAIVIPKVLYILIQNSLNYKKDWDAKKDKYSEEVFKKSEAVVRNFVRIYQRENVLPNDWTYDPATASTLVPHEGDTPLGGVYLFSPKGCVDEWEMNKARNRPRIYNVGLEDNERKSWRQFKELAESNRARVIESSKLNGERIPVDIRHPFVILTGNFAVIGFNKAYQTYIKKGEYNRLRDPVLKEFTYRKTFRIVCNVGGNLVNGGGCYHFYMLIEAVEDGIQGIYRAEVRCEFDGERTLLKFSLTDGTNVDESIKDAYLSMEFKGCEDEVPYDSGMKCRKNAMGSVRYDYFNVSEEEDF